MPAGSHKKINVQPCAKGPIKKPVKMINGKTMMTASGGGSMTDALPAAASSSSAADGGPAAMSTSSAGM